MSSMRASSAALLLLLASFGRALAQPAPALEQPAKAPGGPRPRIGLVLSGGGARGAAHVGVLKVLEELHVPIDAIAGTSMGAIVGALYASGMSPAELEKALTSVDWNRALSDKSDRDLLSFRRKQDDLTLAVKVRVGLKKWKPGLPLGLIQGQKLELLLRSFTSPVATVENFDQLVYPFRAVATDLATTKPVVLGSGDLVTAMRASMSVPAIFAPVEYDNGLLIDGGVADNLPVDVARAMGVDVVIAIDIGAPLARLDQMSSAYSVNDQMITGLMRRETERQLASLRPDDISFAPDLTGFSSADFTKAAEIIPRGEKAARAAAEQLRRYALPPEEWATYRAGLKTFGPQLPRVGKVEVVQNTTLGTEYVSSLLTVVPGQKFDAAQLERDLERIYGLDLFEKVSYRLIPAGADTVDIGIDARKRAWGPDYLQFGLALRDNLENNTSFDFSLRMNRLARSRRGSEWRTDLRIGENQLLQTEYYLPLGGSRGFFLAPRAVARRESTLVLGEQDNVLGVFRRASLGGAVDVGRTLGNWGELRLGYERETGRIVPQADTVFESQQYDEGRVYLRIATDTFDAADFPRDGGVSRGELSYSAKALGATNDLGRASFSITRAHSWGTHTLNLGIEASAFADDAVATALPYTLGGFGRLSGLGTGRLVGRYLALARAMYYQRVIRISLSAIEMPVYVGGSLELGNAWLKRSEIDSASLLLHGSGFIGLDSPLGPIYFGAGLGEHRESAFFFYLGRSF